MTQQTCTVAPHRLMALGTSLRQYAQENLIFILVYIPLSLYVHSIISTSPSTSPSPSPSPFPSSSPSLLPSQSSSLSLSPCITQATKLIQKGDKQFDAFCLFIGTLPKNCALLGGNGNTLKLKTATKVKIKLKSIATVRDLLRTFATFPAPLFSH
jgi:hypothetical protein